MRFLRRFLARLANFATRQPGDQRLREEMEEHLAFLIAENLGNGMPPEEARRQAVLKFGAVGTIKEEYHAEQGLPFIETLAARRALCAAAVCQVAGLRCHRGSDHGAGHRRNDGDFQRGRRHAATPLAVPAPGATGEG